MENFNWTEFSKRVSIDTNMETAYDFWTKSENLEKWFLSKAIFFSENGDENHPSENVTSGNKYQWSWFAQEQAEEGIVTLANGADRMEFTFAGACLVEIQLSEVKGAVLVELTQKEIPTDSSSKENIRMGCAFGWTFYLTNLKSVLEGGLDLRNKDTELVGVINN